MDPANYCVYNLTRNALLSERVVSVSDSRTPTQLLALVLNGPGRDPHFCIRLTNVSVAPEIPRLFAFDLAYLDAEQRIVEIADVGPSTPFPPITDQVASILFLSDQLLPRSGTEIGDFIRICTEAELAALLRAAAQFQAVESPGWTLEFPGPSPPPDPLAGSLIYLPSSGTPQTSEIFLASQTPPSDMPGIIAEEIARASTGELSASMTPLADEPTGLIDEEIQSLEEPETQSLEQPVVQNLPIPPLTRFFETAFQQSKALETPREKKEVPSQIPFNLKAVIQFVDDQLRREREQQNERALPGELPEPDMELASAPMTEFSKVSTPAEPPSEADQPDVLELLERADLVPDAAIEDVSEWSRFHASPTNETELEQDSLRQPEITPEEFQPPLLPQLQPSIQFDQAQDSEPVEAAAVEPPPYLPSPLAPPLPEHPPSPADEVVSLPVKESLPPVVEPAKEPERKIAARSAQKLPFATRVQRWLAGESVSLSGNRRRSQRIALPGLVAFYFTGGAPKPHEIVNISTSGLYLRSKELWSPNTLVQMTLEKSDHDNGEKKSISVLARVVRIDEGGIAHEFVTTEVLANLRARDFLPQQGTNRKELEKFLSRPQ